MKNRKLEVNNFSLGQRTDGSLHTESERGKYGSPIILQSLKTVENYDIIYDQGQLRTRNGYSRWTTVALPGKPKQLYYHTNMARTEDIIFAICNVSNVDKWYRLIQSTTHELIIDEAATSPDGSWRKPIISWGDRVIFSTNTGTYWTDRDRLYDGVKYYNFGIAKPSDTIQAKAVTAPGQNVNDGALTTILNTTDHRKISYKLVLATDINIDSVTVCLKRTINATNESHVRISVYTDTGGSPSSTLANTYSQSDWLSMIMLNVDNNPDENWITFVLKTSINLEAGTYWIVLEGDDAYYNNYLAIGSVADHYISAFYLSVGYVPTNYLIKFYNNGSASWGLFANSVGVFFLGGIVENRYYDYVYTLYNSTYSIESRPSAYTRTELTERGKIFELQSPTTNDAQVDKYRIYRRFLAEGQDVNTPDEEVTEEYKYVGEANIGTNFQDFRTQMGLGAVLQTFDHYCLREPDDTNSLLRSAIVPIGMVIWKGRIFAWVKDSNKLYFSKRLSESGASGLVGDMIPDYFPLENELEIEYPSAILNAKPLSGDQLAIYFRNGSIWLLWGMDAPENPPSEYATREQVTTIGLTACGGLTEFRGSHVYLARQGLYQFTGSQVPQYLSEFVQSILDTVSDTYIDNTRIITYGEEIWILLDEDNDGYQEVVYIFNLQKSVPCWRRYNYGVKIADFVIKSLGEQQRTIYAADATNNHIIQLETGNTDNGQPIHSYFETHRTKVGSARFGLFELFADYQERSVGRYDITLTNLNGQEYDFGLIPASSDDDRGHRSYLRANARTAFSVKLEHDSVKQIDILGFKLDYMED